MRNERNVEKLTDALMQAGRDWSRDRNQAIDFLNLGMVMSFAQFLAARGVLVPSALTDDELLACEVDQESRETPTDRAEVAAATVRQRLERFARGEGLIAGVRMYCGSRMGRRKESGVGDDL